jgi:hypothetical protein
MMDRQVIWQFAVGDPGEATNWITLAEHPYYGPYLDFDKGYCSHKQTATAINLTNDQAAVLSEALAMAAKYHDQEPTS